MDAKETDKRAYGTGSLFKRGKIWYIKFYDHFGNPNELSSKSGNKGDAEKLLTRKIKEAAVAERDNTPLNNKLTLGKMLDVYITGLNKRRRGKEKPP